MGAALDKADARLPDYQLSVMKADAAIVELAGAEDKLADQLARDSTKARIRETEQLADSYDRLGTRMLVAGTAIVGALALASKAAIDWESDWAGVTKTVNGS